MSELFLLRHREIQGLNQLKTYVADGGFSTWKKVVTSLKPQEVMQQVKDSGLRGRGGAGFPTGVKWSFLPNNIWPHYVVANADESEPGTFKDREILESNPYQFIEGLMIASYAVEAHDAYVYFAVNFHRSRANSKNGWQSCTKKASWAKNCSALITP
jgi:NADH-quinone oxidoreductase subunit F